MCLKLGKKSKIHTVPIYRILNVKNAQAWVSMNFTYKINIRHPGQFEK